MLSRFPVESECQTTSGRYSALAQISPQTACDGETSRSLGCDLVAQSETMRSGNPLSRAPALSRPKVRDRGKGQLRPGAER